MRRALAISILLAGCTTDGPSAGPDAGPPADDVVDPVGSADSLDVACWNLEWFPATDSTVELVAELVTSLDLDVVVTEEIASVEAWDALVERLPDHAGVLSTHTYSDGTYQKIGILYREAEVTVGEPELLFETDWYGFPRPGLLVHLGYRDRTLDLLGIHLKAGGAGEDADRRASAIQTIDTWARTQIATEPELIIAGDYNEDLDIPGENVLTPFLDPMYVIRTTARATDGDFSFVPTRRLIDHIVTTGALGDHDAVIPDLDVRILNYTELVSDHLPVVLTIPD